MQFRKVLPRGTPDQQLRRIRTRRVVANADAVPHGGATQTICMPAIERLRSVPARTNNPDAFPPQMQSDGQI